MDFAPVQVDVAPIRYCLEMRQDIAVQKETLFERELKSIESQLDALELEQREISTNLYSYDVSRKEVLETHGKWNETVKKLTLKVTECMNSLNGLHTKLAFLPFHSISKPMNHIYQLELKQESLQRKTTQLDLLLQSKVFANAIILYKTTIESCEEAFNQHADQRKKQRLEEIGLQINRELTTQMMLEGLPKEVIAQTKLVHSQIKRFHQEALEIVSPTIQIMDDPPIQPKDDLFSSTMTHCIGQISLDDDEKTNHQKNQPQKVFSGKLRPDLAFGSGKLLGLIGLGTKWANSDISPHIEKMEKLAQELQGLQEEIQINLQSIYQGNWKDIPQNDDQKGLFQCPFETSLQAKQLELEQIRQSLYPLLATKQIRIGLYYAARLFAHIEEIRFILDHFSKNFSCNNRNVIEALNNTYTCLALLEAPQKPASLFSISAATASENNKEISNEQKIESLFFAARSIAKVIPLKNNLTDPLLPINARIITSLETLVARIGAQVFKTLITTNTWQCVVSSRIKELPEKKTLGFPLSIQEYIEKEITQWLFFSKKPSHIRLDMMLNSLQIGKINSLLKEKIRNNTSFEKIYSSYHPKCPQDIIKFFCSLFELAYSYNESDLLANPYIFSYSKCVAYLYSAKTIRDQTKNEIEQKDLTELISEVEAKLGENQKKSIRPMGSHIKPKKAAIKNFINGRGDAENDRTVLLHLLSKALWLSEDIESENILKTHFSKIQKNNFVLSGEIPINYLIAAFALRQSKNKKELCPFEQEAVTSTLEIYDDNALLLPDELQIECHQWTLQQKN